MSEDRQFAPSSDTTATTTQNTSAASLVAIAATEALDPVATTIETVLSPSVEPNPSSTLSPPSTLDVSPEAVSNDEDEWEADDSDEVTDAMTTDGAVTASPKRRRRKRQVRSDAAELRLLGRRALCKRIADLAPLMLKMVKLRLLGGYLPSTRGLEDDDLTQVIKKDAAKLADRNRIIAALNTADPDVSRGELRAILFAILLQEETYGSEEHRLEEKVIAFEKDLVKRSRSLDLTELQRQDPERWRHYEIYRVVLEEAWADGLISTDEARILATLRNHLGISLEEHWLISALLKRFPKEKNALHTADEINEARKELQREGVLWSYRDEDNHNIDVIPAEVAEVIRRNFARQELQRTNYARLLHHDSFTTADLRNALQKHGLNRSGIKAELIDRLVASDSRPSEVLGDLDREKLCAMCGSFGLKASGNKAELVERLIDFYDDLTFEERVSKDPREVWYNNYELIASRSYAELRAKKLITKDNEIERMFEGATAFLFESRFYVSCVRSDSENRADGRLPLDNNQSILWDCKSVCTF